MSSTLRHCRRIPSCACLWRETHGNTRRPSRSQVWSSNCALRGEGRPGTELVWPMKPRKPYSSTYLCGRDTCKTMVLYSRPASSPFCDAVPSGPVVTHTSQARPPLIRLARPTSEPHPVHVYSCRGGYSTIATLPTTTPCMRSMHRDFHLLVDHATHHPLLKETRMHPASRPD